MITENIVPISNKVLENPILEFKLESGFTQLKKVLLLLKRINAIVYLTFDPTGMKVLHYSEEEDCIVDLFFEKEMFDRYVCDNTHTIILNLRDFKIILDRTANPQNSKFKTRFIEFYYHKDSENIILKIYKNKCHTFYLKLLEDEIQESQDLFERCRNVQYNNYFNIKPKLITDSIKDAKLFSDKVIIKTDQREGILITSSSEICDTEHIIIDSDELNNFNLVEEESETFSLRYLNYIFAPTFVNSIVSDLKISLKSNNNLKVKFKFSFGGTMTVFLKPFRELDDITESDQDSPVDFSDPNFLDHFKDNSNQNENTPQKKELKYKTVKKQFTQENFLESFKDDKKREFKHTQQNFTKSGNIIISKVTNKFVKTHVKKANQKKKAKKQSLIKQKEAEKGSFNQL